MTQIKYKCSLGDLDYLNPNEQGNITKKSQTECDWSQRRLVLSRCVTVSCIMGCGLASGLRGYRKGGVRIFTLREPSPHSTDDTEGHEQQWLHQAVRTGDLPQEWPQLSVPTPSLLLMTIIFQHKLSYKGKSALSS